ncbi:MAG: zf-TFIIB domain-containing protein [Cyanobacteria bacterium J06598_1]
MSFLGTYEKEFGVRCPKEPTTDLAPDQLTAGLDVQCCPSCKGNWLPKFNYQRWQAINAGLEAIPEPVLPLALETEYKAAPLDSGAGLCPECGTYLKRSRINLKSTSFYVERCPICEGLWCDRGEWEIFAALGLHIQIPVVFNPDWQAKVRTMEQVERQRIAVVEKVGPELAEKVFELGEALAGHPHGDFAVAYLMRKFDK